MFPPRTRQLIVSLAVVGCTGDETWPGQDTATPSGTSSSSGSTSEAGASSSSPPDEQPSATASDPGTSPEMAACGDNHVDINEECDDGNQADDDDCLSDCKLASCGDGTLFVGVEQCDDGNLDNSDGCLDNCTVASCGDGHVRKGVEQCDDGNADDHDGCRSDCQAASCGDGIVQAGVEACDSKGANTAACDADCSLPACGDGLTNHAAGEECDDGNDQYADNCYPTCKAPTMLVFVTSERYPGNLGGTVGANAKCQALATAAKLTGTFKAWLWTTQKPPAELIVQSPGRYMLLNKVVVAKNFDELMLGTLLAPINVLETGEELVGDGDPETYDAIMWTGINEGTEFGAENNPNTTCNNWTSSDKAFMGETSGSATPFLGYYGDWYFGLSCTYSLRLVCVQEPWHGPYPVPG